MKTQKCLKKSTQRGRSLLVETRALIGRDQIEKGGKRTVKGRSLGGGGPAPEESALGH